MRVLNVVLLAVVLVFAVMAMRDFASSISGAERGLVQFEKTCPIHSMK
ncbi:MAG: hypothetical protein JO322_10610 [Candidatus Eremiobacteraeota bacterium]|nr:hypothetical protein [Candidatus Eremiobacteraeota bacterium]